MRSRLTTSHRDFISTLARSAVAAGLVTHSQGLPHTPGVPQPLKISIFSKHLQWLDYRGMAQTAAEIGFDGIDLTVRAGGHVLPARVQEDLPKAAKAVRKGGLIPSSYFPRRTGSRQRRTGVFLSWRHPPIVPNVGNV